MIDDYIALQVALQRHLKRDDLTADIPDFIASFEAAFNLEMRTADMEKVVTLVPDANGICDLPDDYLEWRTVNSNAPCSGEMQFIIPSVVAEKFSTNPGGMSRYFTIVGHEMGTYPASQTTIVLDYYAKVPALTTVNTTNWLLSKAPNAYLYGSLLEAAPLADAGDRVQLWGTHFDRAMAGLRKQDRGARYARGRARVMGPTP